MLRASAQSRYQIRKLPKKESKTTKHRRRFFLFFSLLFWLIDFSPFLFLSVFVVFPFHFPPNNFVRFLFLRFSSPISFFSPNCFFLIDFFFSFSSSSFIPCVSPFFRFHRNFFFVSWKRLKRFLCFVFCIFPRFLFFLNFLSLFFSQAHVVCPTLRRSQRLRSWLVK